jgi:hypothetical protein
VRSIDAKLHRMFIACSSHVDRLPELTRHSRYLPDGHAVRSMPPRVSLITGSTKAPSGACVERAYLCDKPAEDKRKITKFRKCDP